MSSIVVRVDERLRLAGCLLAASDWPEREQRLKPYKPHRLAEVARRALAGRRVHPAVAAALSLEPAQLFAYALADDWPGPLAAHVADFATNPAVTAFCADSEAEWQAARAELESVLARGDLLEFFVGLFGASDQALQVHPNLLYPGRQSVPVVVSEKIVLSQPPPAAWGASPPWHYRERPDEVLGAVVEGLARPLFVEAQAPEPAALALAAAVLFLRQTEGAAAGDQFMLMEARTRKLPQLPAFVHAIQEGKALNREGRQEREGKDRKKEHDGS